MLGEVRDVGAYLTRALRTGEVIVERTTLPPSAA